MSTRDRLSADQTTEDGFWICHICGKTSRGEGAHCEVCFRVACHAHLRRTSVYNRESGLYEFTSVCMECAMAEILQ
jgi:hypothetical protein